MESAPTGTRWLVDGMNVIGVRPDGWWRDRPRAVVDLVGELDSWAGSHQDEVTAVFDGERPRGLPDRPRRMEVVFVGRGRSADDEIARRVAGDPDPGSRLVVTSDRDLARRVSSHGARVVPASAFRRRLGPAPPPRPTEPGR